MSVLKPSVPNSKINRPLLGISSCLLGERVRYDGVDKQDSMIAEHLSQYFDWYPLCPEVGAGLGVPRPPIQLVGNAQHPQAIGVHDPGLDVTAALDEFAEKIIPQLQKLSGYIFKNRSPSCGLIDVPLFNASGALAQTTHGLFAAAVCHAFPRLPVIDERQLRDGNIRKRFIEQVHACFESEHA